MQVKLRVLYVTVALVVLCAVGCGEKKTATDAGTTSVSAPPASAPGVPTDVKQQMSQSQQADTSLRNAATSRRTVK